MHRGKYIHKATADPQSYIINIRFKNEFVHDMQM